MNDGATVEELTARRTSRNFLLRQLNQSAKEIGIAPRRIAPRHVRRHAVALNPSPRRSVVIGGASALENIGKIFGGDRSEFEAGLPAAGDGQFACVDDG